MFAVHSLLVDTHPHLAAQLVDQAIATTIATKSNKVLEWRCPADAEHTWMARPFQRVKHETCPHCSGRIPNEKTCLSATHPELAAELVNPDDGKRVTYGSHEMLKWRCLFGHEWEARVGSRSGGMGCPVCRGRTVIAGVNDIATLRPDIAETMVDQSLITKVGPGSQLVVEFMCENGHVTRTEIASRARGYRCRECVNYGFDPMSTEALVYVVAPNDKREPLIFGKVASREHLDAAMGGEYADCSLVGVGGPVDGSLASTIEADIKASVERVRGPRRRGVLESAERSMATVDAVIKCCSGHDVDFTLIDADIFGQGDSTPTHHHFGVCECGLIGTKAITRHDSAEQCCKRSRAAVRDFIAQHHYLQTVMPMAVHTFASRDENGNINAALLLGTGSSSTAARSLSSDARSLELIRLASDGSVQLSAFVSGCLDMIDYPLFVYSYADAGRGHSGGIYRACSFNYSGWTDMLRSQPLRKKPKGIDVPFSEWDVQPSRHRYWRLVGIRGAKRQALLASVKWGCYDHRILGFADGDNHRRVTKQELAAAVIAPR